jgi:transcriptional regulator with XRE-family HTH domain
MSVTASAAAQLSLWRLSNWLKHYCQQQQFTAVRLSAMLGGDTIFPAFRIRHIIRGKYAAEDSELYVLAAYFERQGDKGIPLDTLRRMRDLDVKQRTPYRTRRIDRDSQSILKQQVSQVQSPDDLAPFYIWLAVWRKSLGLNGRQLAKLIGCSAHRISSLEHNKVTVLENEILAIAVLLEKKNDKVDWLSRLAKMRDMQPLGGVKRITPATLRQSAVRAQASYVENPAVVSLLATINNPPIQQESQAPKESYAQEVVEAPVRLGVVDRVTITVGGVQIQGNTRDLRKILGLV